MKKVKHRSIDMLITEEELKHLKILQQVTDQMLSDLKNRFKSEKIPDPYTGPISQLVWQYMRQSEEYSSAYNSLPFYQIDELDDELDSDDIENFETYFGLDFSYSPDTLILSTASIHIRNPTKIFNLDEKSGHSTYFNQKIQKEKLRLLWKKLENANYGSKKIVVLPCMPYQRSYAYLKNENDKAFKKNTGKQLEYKKLLENYIAHFCISNSHRLSTSEMMAIFKEFSNNTIRMDRRQLVRMSQTFSKNSNNFMNIFF